MDTRKTTNPHALAHLAVEVTTRPLGLRLPSLPEQRLPDPSARFLFNEALGRGGLHGAYFVSQMLHEWYPDRVVMEAPWAQFDVIHFARAGNCTLTARSVPHTQWQTVWTKREDAREYACRHALVGWYDIRWNDHEIEVLVLPREDPRSGRHWWIVASTHEVGEAFLCAVIAWSRAPRSEILVYGNREFVRDQRLYDAIRGASLDDLVLENGLAETILTDVSGFFESEPIYRRYGAPWKRGILFTGPPGNGKTQTVKGVINALKRRCIYVKSFRDSGSPSDETIGEVFDRARQIAPCVIVLEDLDSMIDKWNRSYFLNELDGFAGNDGILTLATTNHPERLDPAILDRPSRFDRKYVFALPAEPERLAYLGRWMHRVEPEMRMTRETVERFARETAGFSYAYLKELTLTSTLRWVSAQPGGSMDVAMGQELAVLRRQIAEARLSKRERKERLKAQQETPE